MSKQRPRGVLHAIGRGLFALVRVVFVLMLMVIPVPGARSIFVALFRDRRSHPALVVKKKAE